MIKMEVIGYMTDLCQKFEPASDRDRAPENLTHAKTEGAHEVIARGPVPIPDLQMGIH